MDLKHFPESMTQFPDQVKQGAADLRERMTREEQLKAELADIEARRLRSEESLGLLNGLIYSRWGGYSGLQPREIYDDQRRKYPNFYSKLEHDFNLLPITLDDQNVITPILRFEGGVNVFYDKPKRPKRITRLAASFAYLLVKIEDAKGLDVKLGFSNGFMYHEHRNDSNEEGKFVDGFRLNSSIDYRNPSFGERIHTDSEVHQFLDSLLSEAIAVTVAEQANAQD